jgi:ribosomal protein S18 acetylase RimI-like enzyme
MRGAAAATEVRAAGRDDVEAIARLAGELGYPSTEAQVRERFEAIAEDRQHALFVATGPTGQVVGWIQLSEERSVVADPRAEIAGLVVDANYRSAGVGRLLVVRGEAWARERGLRTIGLRSNVIRDRAHNFYLRLGYAVTKSQKVFRKTL